MKEKQTPTKHRRSKSIDRVRKRWQTTYINDDKAGAPSTKNTKITT